VQKTTVSEDVDTIGVLALKTAAISDWVTVAMSGLWEVTCVDDTYTLQKYLTADTNDGLAKETTSSSDKPFAKIVEAKTVAVDGELVWALLHTPETF
jgi:hypothetical protein